MHTAQLMEGGRVLAWDRGLILAAEPGFDFRDPDAATVKPMQLRSLSSMGEVVDSLIGSLPGDDAVVVRTSNMMMVTSGPFVRRTLTTASGGALYSALTDSTYIEVHHLTDHRRDTIRLPMERRVLPASTVDSSLGDVTQSMPADARQQVMAELRKHIPSHWPALRGLARADNGEVAVGLITEPGKFSEWRIVGSDGRVRARYRLPPRVELYRVRGDRAWAVVLDENDVPRVYYLGLRRPGM